MLKRYSLSFIVSTFIFCSGSITANQQHQLNYNSTICEANLVRGVVTDIKKHTDSIITFEFDIKTYKTKESWHNLNRDEKVLVYLKKKDSTFSVKTNHSYLVKGYLINTPPRLTPNNIDYKKIYAEKGISYLLYTKESSLALLSSQQSFLEEYKSDFISYLRTNLNESTSGFISALVANEKEYIPVELKKKINRNGISHLIAISGLHIGIIYLLLNYLGNLIPKTKQYYRNSVSVMICLLLILYGIFCGFSPSIARSVTMFCVMQIAQVISRKNNTMNSLFVSAFLLLIIQPSELFQVGFQLSFSGVLGILLFYKQIRDWVQIDHLIIRKVWEGLSVTLAAQIGVLPLLLFYFKTFSINGIFLSLSLTFLTMFLVGFGLLLIVFFKVVVINAGLIYIIEKFSFTFFWLLDISEFAPLSVSYSKMTVPTVILCYYLIIEVSIFIKHKRITSIQNILVVLISFSSFQLIPLHNPPIYIYQEDDITLQSKEKTYSPWLKSKKRSFAEISFQENKLLCINEKLILFQKNRHLSNYPKIDILILCKEIPIEALRNIELNQIIYDKSISKKYSKLVNDFFNKKNKNIHDLRKDGFFML